MKAALALLGAALALAGAGAASDLKGDWPTRTGSESAAEVAASFPESAAMRRRALVVELEQGAVAAAAVRLAELAAMGYALSPESQERAGRALRPAVREGFAGNAVPLGRPVERGAVPAELGLVESVAELRGLLVVSGVSAQDLFVSRDGKTWRALGLSGLASLNGLAADPRRGLIWAASGIYDLTPRRDGAFSGLVAIDPVRGTIIERIAAPAGVVPGDIALGPGGTLYVSDPLHGTVWRIGRDTGQFAALIAPGRLRSPQGLVLAEDGRRLYVSDYGYGLAVVDLASGALDRLSAERPMMLDGIDGLQRLGKWLVGIQNGTSPIRIVAVRLSADGRRAADLAVLLRAPPGPGEPTAGMIRDRRLLYVGNARWDLYGAEKPAPSLPDLTPTRLQSLPLSPIA